MKKLFKLLFLLAMPLSLASCGQEPVPAPIVAKIDLDTPVINLDVNGTFQLEPVAYDLDGNVIKNKEFIFFSSNKTVASVLPNGLVTALKPGASTITCIADKQISRCLVKVAGEDIPDVTSLSFSPDTVKIKFGSNYKPNLIISPAEASASAVAWNSSDESVATVADGVIHAEGLGEAKIYAAYGTISATLNLTVVESGGDVFSITIDKEATSTKVGSTFDLNAICSEEATITWTSTDSGVASVEGDGKVGHVTALAKGKAMITAKANGQEASCMVTVTDGTEPGGDYNLQVFFYIDYNNVSEEEPYAVRDWYVETAFGTFGDQGKPEDPATAPDPAFPKFVGWSSHPIIDNIPEDLWDFEKNVVPDGSYVFVLYGIWINDQEEQIMKNKKLLILSSLFLTFAMTSCGENFPSHVTYPEGDDGSVQTPYEEYDNGKRVESISFKENDVSLNLSEKVEYQIEASFAPSDAHNPKLTYTSNTPEIAVVDESGKVTMVAPGNASIKVSADNGVSSDFKISGYIPATSIRINPHVEGGTLLDIYDSKQFSIAAEPVNATQKDVVWSVVDKDGNPSTVAVISETGLLSFENAKGVHDEEVYVVATSKADASLVATEKVIVNDARKYASSVKINKDGAEVSTIDVLLGSPEQLTAVVDPVDHTNPVSWSSEDATVATVDEGLVSAVKAPATTNVKASIDGLESKVVVNTTKIDVSSVTLDKTELTLNKGEEATLVATVAPADASFPDVSFVVADGSNEFVSIDDNGKVTAKKQTGLTPAKVMAVSKDNSEIFAECSVTVTNKVTAIEIVNNYEKMYYGGETYTLSLDKTPYDCDSFNVTWTSSNDSIATVDNNGVVTTNSSELTGTVTIEATVDGTDIGDFIDINIIKPAAPFTVGKMYLVGNRNYQASSLDFEHASWDDSDYAVELTSMPDPNYKNQWALTDFHFERYDIASNGGDLFKIRSVDWPEFSLDQASTKSAYFTEEGNLAVSNSEKYDLYFKENLDDSFSLYIMSEFKNGTMYLVGNRDYHTGESSGVAGTDTSWNDSSKALALTYNENKGEYHVANTFEVNDEFKVRSDMFYDLVLGQDQATASIAHQDGETGNIILDKEGKFDIYFKSELGVWTVYMCDYVEPTPFMWGIAGSATGWKLDTAHPFAQSTVEGDALYTYKLNGFEFAKGATWKVTNTDGEWVSNQAGVGFDTSRSTEGAFTVNVEGNIEVETAGVYDITLNIWEGASKTGSDFTSGVQIYAVAHEAPVGPSISFGIANPEVAVEGSLEIPVTATGCSDLVYSITEGNEYISIDDSSDDTKLVVNGLYEGSSIVRALASDGTENSITIVCSESPTPVEDKDYIVKVCHDEVWSQLDMSQTVGDESQYEYTGDFDKDDVFVIHMYGETWYHFEDVKLGCLSLVSLEGSENIKFNAAGNYTIYADYDADEDGNHIWIKKNIAPATMTIEGSDPVTMNVHEGVPGEFMLLDVELETNEFFSFEYDGIIVGYNDLKSDSPAGVTCNTAKHIAVTTAGSYDIYFDTAKIGSGCLYIAEHKAVIPDYVAHACVGGSWIDIPMEKDDENQYVFTYDFSEGDSFKLHLTGDDWRGYDNLEDGCASLVSVDPLDTDRNILVTETARYTVYAKPTDGKNVWINKAPIPVVGDFSVTINGTSHDLTLNEKSGEYYLDNIDLSRDDLLEFYNGDQKLTVSAKVAPEGSANNCFLNSSNKIELIRALAAKEGEGIYFDPVNNTVWVNGNHESYSVVCNGEEYDLEPHGSGDGYDEFTFTLAEVSDGDQLVFSKNGLVVDAGPETGTGNNATADTYKGNICCKVTKGGENLSVYLKVYADRYEVWVGQAKGDVVTVTFTINYGTENGQGVYIVGDFCDWDPTKGIRGTWTEGNNWVFTIEMPVDTVWSFKFVINSYDNPTDPAIRWEENPNRSYTFLTDGSETFVWQAQQIEITQ